MRESDRESEKEWERADDLAHHRERTERNKTCCCSGGRWNFKAHGANRQQAVNECVLRVEGGLCWGIVY